ncbi:hypothetical protein [Flavobacterium sp. CLA17]|uniref:hypothetical protein n=1 Tax=Flavobacterium sp. CLA17 TaxID=2724135 RepID=UPI0014914587|nr:hypothetical protein [Flavobacterium sp. CLA17]QSB26186.1 hypothetical protein HAV12_017620 [Flavobacterium sp. CLA17]
MKRITTKIYLAIIFLMALQTSAQISTGTGGAGSLLPNNPTTNKNIGIGVTNPKGKLEIAGFPAVGQTYTFVDDADSFAKSILLNIGTLRENSTATGGYRLLTFYDIPPSNISGNARTMLAVEDRNDANRLRHTAITNGESLFRLSDKTQKNVFQIYEDGTNAFIDLTKPGSYLTVGGIAVWPVAHNFWVKTGTAKFDNNVFIDTNLCIGTSSFTDGATTYKLSVKGKIRAEEIKVYNTWADYVFSPFYELPTLNAVETFIQKNGHLPNVPSAKEITEKGLELGEMTKIQQEKIEELTLYLIQQHKEIEELKAQVKALLIAK